MNQSLYLMGKLGGWTSYNTIIPQVLQLVSLNLPFKRKVSLSSLRHIRKVAVSFFIILSGTISKISIISGEI